MKVLRLEILKDGTVKLKAYDLVKLYFMNYSMTAQWRAQYRNAPTPIRERAKGEGRTVASQAASEVCQRALRPYARGSS